MKRLTRTGIWIEDFHCKTQMNGKNGNSTAEFDKTMTISKQLTFTPGWTKWWDSWKLLSSNEWWWVMEMILIFREHLLTIGNANPILAKTTTRLLRWNSFWRIRAKKKTLSGIAWQSCSCGQEDKPLSTTLIPYKVHEGGGGVTEREGLILESEHQAGYRQSIIPKHSI